GGITGVFCERAVACFAVHMRVLALVLGVGNIAVTGFACFMPGKLHRMGGDVCDGIAAIVAVLSEAFWNNVGSDDEKDDESQNKQPREAKQMSCILEGLHSSAVS